MERRRGERYGDKFRRRAVEQMNACDNIVRLSQKLRVNRRLLYKWRDDLEALYSVLGILSYARDARTTDCP